MTPQSTFMVVAPIAGDRIGKLRDLLTSMNYRRFPGIADPDNAIVPFGAFGTLHYARFVILDDETLVDFAKLDMPIPEFPVTLAFLGDCDGDAHAFLADIANHPIAAAGLRRIFGHCEDFAVDAVLLDWMKQRERRPAATYVNWIGRTVQQIKKEDVLRTALGREVAQYIGNNPGALSNAGCVRAHLLRFADQHPELMPTTARTPVGWQVRNLLHFAIVPLTLLVPWILGISFLVPRPALPWVVVPYLIAGTGIFLWLVRIAPATFALLIVSAASLLASLFLFLALRPLLLIPPALGILAFLWALRWHERNEPEIIYRPTSEHERELAKLEDQDVGNQYTVIGSVKPSAFRRTLLVIILWLVDYGARHVYNRGFLSRVQSIHFARWVFLDGKRRVLFASNYDGNHQAYMDDFINKVGWGLNIVFSNGLGYPRTNWLLKDGANNEQRFKDTNRRHQIPTQVWYKAYPGLTAFDLVRNTRIREGLERRQMTDAEVRAWLRDL